MKPRVMVAHAADYQEKHIERALHEIVACLNLHEDIKRGSRILVKPNWLIADPVSAGCTTHPAVIEAVLKLICDYGARPFIGDSPAFGSVAGVIHANNLMPIIKKYQAQVVSFKRNADITRRTNNCLEYIPQKHHAQVKKLSTISTSVLDFDYIINVPKLKAHVQMTMSGATKNIYGCIKGKSKVIRHTIVKGDVELFCAAILCMYQRVCPELTIVDAINTLEEKGPRHGKIVERQLLVGGTDCVATDTVLLHLMGKSVHCVPLLKWAHQYGIGYTDLNDIDICNPDALDLKGFAFPSDLLYISFSVRRILKSCIRHIMKLFSEKASKRTPSNL